MVKDEDESNQIPSHPCLINPILYIGGVLEKVSNQEIVEGLIECLRLRPSIVRTGDDNAIATGTLEFESLFKAEKAYATVATIYSQHNCTLSLHLSELPSTDPLPTATTRLVNHLPLETTPGQLFELFRPFGPINRATIQKGIGQVTFYDEAHAKKATSEMHCFEYNSSTITVKRLEKPRIGRAETPAFVPAPPAVVPPPSPHPALNPIASAWSPPKTVNRSLSPSIHNSTPPLQPSTRNSTPSKTSALNNSNLYSTPVAKKTTSTFISPANTAIDPCNLFLKSLDSNLTSQDLYVLFEPFGKVISARVMKDEQTGKSKEFGFVSFQDPLAASKALEVMDGSKLGLSQKKVVVRLHEPKAHREEKFKDVGSGSPSSLSVGSEFDGVLSKLEALKTTARTEILIPSTPEPKGEGKVVSPVKSQVESPIESPVEVLVESPVELKVVNKVGTPLSEHERLLTAVMKIDPIRAEEIVEMMETLPRKERALCLFNPDYLRTKVSDALLVLSSSSEEEDADNAVVLRHSTSTSTSTSPKPASTLPTPDTTPRKLSLELPSSPSPSAIFSLPTTIAELGRLPAIKIISLINEGSLMSSLGIERVSEEEEIESHEFMQSLEGKPVNEIKQKLGDRLFKAIKTMGIKGAPKITITLLDSEELRPLAHLINYPIILREKVLSHVPVPVASTP